MTEIRRERAIIERQFRDAFYHLRNNWNREKNLYKYEQAVNRQIDRIVAEHQLIFSGTERDNRYYDDLKRDLSIMIHKEQKAARLDIKDTRIYSDLKFSFDTVFKRHQ